MPKPKPNGQHHYRRSERRPALAGRRSALFGARLKPAPVSPEEFYRQRFTQFEWTFAKHYEEFTDEGFRVFSRGLFALWLEAFRQPSTRGGEQ